MSQKNFVVISNTVKLSNHTHKKGLSRDPTAMHIYFKYKRNVHEIIKIAFIERKKRNQFSFFWGGVAAKAPRPGPPQSQGF
jgi:hypothetical protein